MNKSHLNKARDVETRANKTFEQMSSEEIGLLLNNNYQMIMQSQNNIGALNTELQKRQRIKQQQKNVDEVSDDTSDKQVIMSTLKENINDGNKGV